MDELQVEFHSVEEQAAILASIDNAEHKVLALLMLDVGSRVTETCRLTWEHCDFRTKTVTIKTIKQRGKDKPRTVPMSERLYVTFDALISERVKEEKPLKGFVFPSPKHEDQPISRSAPYMMLKRLQAKAPQIGAVRPHKLRHTAATNAIANGASLVEVRNMLGHSDSRVTQIYTHTDPERLRAVINAATPRPSWLMRVKARLFPPRRTLINLLITQEVPGAAARMETARRRWPAVPTFFLDD